MFLAPARGIGGGGGSGGQLGKLILQARWQPGCPGGHIRGKRVSSNSKYRAGCLMGHPSSTPTAV